jgi:predicted transcriptional regulator
MTTLKVGIASYDEMKARTMAVARGERRVAADEPKVWFTSTESFAKVLSAGNRELLRIIADKTPSSLDELARITGKAKSNLSRTLRTMEGYGLVRLERGERGRITPKVMHDRVELDLPLTLAQGKLKHDRLGGSRPDRRQPIKAGAFRATRFPAAASTGCRRPGEGSPSDQGSK